MIELIKPLIQPLIITPMHNLINVTRSRSFTKVVVVDEPLTKPFIATPTCNPIHTTINTLVFKPKTPTLMNKKVQNANGKT